MKIKKVIEYPKPNEEGVYDINQIKTYYIFSDTENVHGFSNNYNATKCLQLRNESITYVDSGIYDYNTGKYGSTNLDLKNLTN